jgi:hypothetical protein
LDFPLGGLDGSDAPELPQRFVEIQDRVMSNALSIKQLHSSAQDSVENLGRFPLTMYGVDRNGTKNTKFYIYVYFCVSFYKRFLRGELG